MSRVISLTAENFKKLKAVKISFERGVNEISGDNAAGKSAIFDAIYAAFGGKDAVPADPIRHGAKSGFVEVQIDDPKWIIRRKFGEGGVTGVTIETHASERIPSPQRLLDEIYGEFAFDPGAFMAMKPAERIALLLKIVKYSADPKRLQDLAPDSAIEDPIERLDVRYKTIFEKRTGESRVLEQLAGELAGVGGPKDDDPKAMVNVSELMKERDALRAMRDAVLKKQDERVRLRNQSEEVQQQIVELTAKINSLLEKKKAVDQRVQALSAEIEAAPAVDTEEIDEQIENAQGVNERLSEVARWRHLLAKHGLQKQVVEDHTKHLTAIKAYKEELVAGAKFPVDGLGFGDGDVTYKGVLLDQASTAETIRVSAGIGMFLNPKLKLMNVKNGSLMSEKNLRVLAEIAAEHDFQVLVETVDTSGKIGIFIEAGEVAAVNPPRFQVEAKAIEPALKDGAPF